MVQKEKKQVRPIDEFIRRYRFLYFPNTSPSPTIFAQTNRTHGTISIDRTTTALLVGCCQAGRGQRRRRRRRCNANHGVDRNLFGQQQGFHGRSTFSPRHNPYPSSFGSSRRSSLIFIFQLNGISS